MPHGVPEEGEPIPSVDAGDLRRKWNVKGPWTCESPQAARSDGVNYWAVSRRDGMIRMLVHSKHGQLLAPWRHGEELDDAVFRIAATFPMRALQRRVYKIAGHDIFGFDPNAFVEKLIAETGISHVWEPIPTRIPEGGWSFGFVRATFNGQASPDRQYLRDEREVKRCAREVLWDAWNKYFHLQPPQRSNSETHTYVLSTLFADFLIDNLDLAQQLISVLGSSGEGAEPFAILTELERRAKGWGPSSGRLA